MINKYTINYLPPLYKYTWQNLNNPDLGFTPTIPVTIKKYKISYDKL